MTRCNIHIDKTLKYVYEREGTGKNQQHTKLDIGKVCITCFIGVWNAMEEAVK